MAVRKPTIPETFTKLVAFFGSQHVPFVVVGGLAVGLQGEPRATRDVDFMIRLPSSKVVEFARAAKLAGFDVEPELAETQWLASGFLRLGLGPPGKQVDIDLMACNSEFLEEATWRAQQAHFCGLVVPVAAAEDLMLCKLSAWREKDIPDIRSVFLRHAERLDVAYLRKWAGWFAAKNPHFKDVPERLEAILQNRPGPPARPG